MKVVILFRLIVFICIPWAALYGLYVTCDIKCVKLLLSPISILICRHKTAIHKLCANKALVFVDYRIKLQDPLIRCRTPPRSLSLELSFLVFSVLCHTIVGYLIPVLCCGLLEDKMETFLGVLM